MARGGARAGAGRKRKPLELKVLEGTWRRDRDAVPTPVTPAVPDGLVEFPEPPSHLAADQRALWLDLRQHCGGWVRPGDWMAVAGVVRLEARLRQVQAAYESRRGTKDPMGIDTVVNLETKLLREQRGYLAILGLSPADRAKVSAPKPAVAPKASKWAGIITGVR